MQVNTPETVWHDDGHTMHLEIRGPELVIWKVTCPHEGKGPESPCYSHRVDGHCVVNYFINVYGLDVNQGSTSAASEIQFAWTLVGDQNDLDASQIWIIPVEDPTYSAWKHTQLAQES